jgi:hypothetical protein
MGVTSANPGIDVTNHAAELISYADNAHYLAALVPRFGVQQLTRELQEASRVSTLAQSADGH